MNRDNIIENTPILFKGVFFTMLFYRLALYCDLI